LDGVQPAAKDGEPLPGLTGLVPKVFAALALIDPAIKQAISIVLLRFIKMMKIKSYKLNQI
jgi:hypothetical protein